MLTQEDLEKEIAKELTQDTLLQTRVRSMFRLQNDLNLLIMPDCYTNEDVDYNRASMVELNELMDHYGYKWWKKQDTNVAQCQLEVIDIAHFHISQLIKTAVNNSLEYDYYVDELSENIQPVAVDKSPKAVRNLIDEATFLASSKNFSSKQLGLLMATFDIDAEELFAKYVLKNTLNIFRIKNGYKEGTYKKTWDGKEDNEVLMEIFLTLDHESPTLADDLYGMLEVAYKDMT